MISRLFIRISTAALLAAVLLSGCAGYGVTRAHYVVYDADQNVVRQIDFQSGKEYGAFSARLNEAGFTVHAVDVQAFDGQQIEAGMWQSFWVNAIDGAKLGASGGASASAKNFPGLAE